MVNRKLRLCDLRLQQVGSQVQHGYSAACASDGESWVATSSANRPRCASNSSKLPRSTTRPFSNTRITSASRTVLNRWAMMNVVRPFINVAIARDTRASVAASSALVASSKIKIGGSFSNARAIANRCRCPPDSVAPRSPTTVS